MPPTLNTKGFQKRMSSWYHETRRPNKSDNPKVTGTKSTGPKPATKQELRTWLAEYCEGVKKHGEPNTWDVTSVTDMSELFLELDTFNAPIDQWVTSKVTDMNGMFYKATTFNQPLTFDTSAVTTMSGMFRDDRAFNQPLTFDTRKVTDMRSMFWNASAMTYPKPGERPKPTTKEELRTWLEEYCRGEKNHGEPNTWDVTSVTVWAHVCV